MTDKEKFLALMKKFGLNLRNDEHAGGLILDADNNGKVGGYDGFYSAWEFDEHGKFVTTGAWE